MTQSGGTNPGTLYLGYNSTGSGTYNISGGPTLVLQRICGLLRRGHGHAVRRHEFDIRRPLSGLQLRRAGAYSLSGDGNRLSAGTEYVGYAGTGSFARSAGANTLSGSLYLGYASGGNGAAAWAASQLSAASEYIGYAPSATALVQQTGGTNTATFLSIGAGGQYQFSGGTLSGRQRHCQPGRF